MAQTGQIQNVFEEIFDEHRAAGLGIISKRRQTIFTSHIDDWSELHALMLSLQTYESQHGQYTTTLMTDFHINLSQIYTTLEALLLPNQTSSESFEQALDSFFKTSQALAAKAVSVRNEWSFLSDNKERQYEQASHLLKKVGCYVEKKILNTPWSVPVSEKAYLLTALKDSPEALFEAQKDGEIQNYVKELNEAKRHFPKKALKENGSDLSDQVKEYTAQLEAVEKKFQSVGSNYLKQIQDIEKTRQERWGWGLGNLFADVADLFMGNESETDKIKRYQNKKHVIDALEQSYNRFSKEARPLQYRADFHSLGHQLLKGGASLNSKQLNDLRIAINQLLKMKDSVEQINSFIEEFKIAIFDQIENEQGPTAILASQFEFLTERLVTSNEQLNTIRLSVIAAINVKLTQFDNPADVLKFVNKLETAKVGCLDASNKLLTTLNQYKKDCKAWNDIIVLGPSLMNGLIDEAGEATLYTSARAALTSGLPLIKQAAVEFDKQLQEQVLLTITALKECPDLPVDHLVKSLRIYLSFYASPEMHIEEELFASSKKGIRQAIRDSFNNMSATDAIAYINKWEKLETAFNLFDSSLYQDIQNKKNQYNSMQLLNAGWNDLLVDAAQNKMTQDETEKFIAAVLWLDKPNHVSTGMADIFHFFKPSEQDVFRAEVKQKLMELKETIDNDLALLAKESLTKEKSIAFSRRLTFLAKANSMYTRELGKLREHVLKTISRHLNSNLSIQETDRYLTDLLSMLPDGFKNDIELSDLIFKTREKMVISHFTHKQAEIYREYKSEIDFLLTGDMSLWDTIKFKILNVERRKLTPENIRYWRHEFLTKYDVLRKQCELAVLDASYRAGESVEEKKIINAYLNVLIAKDMGSVSGKLTDYLINKADLKRKRALERFSKAFKLADKSVDVSPLEDTLFSFGYFVIVENLRLCQNNPEAVKASGDFVRKFHDMAQNYGGFTTKIIAGLPYEVLEQMYETWAEDPSLSFAKDSAVISLNKDIIGRVDATRDTHIQVPQYLMLYMVLELIAADFNALLRGKLVDDSLLSGRIKFAIPHLRQLLNFESNLNQNKDGIGLRNALLLQLQALNDEDIYDIKDEFISDLQNPDINILDIIRNFPEDMTDKFPAATADMIRQLQYRFADRYRTVMVKLLDQNFIDCIDDCVPNGMLEINPEDTRKFDSKSYRAKVMNYVGGLFAPKSTEPEYEYKPNAAERIGNILDRLTHNEKREMIQQLMPTAKKQNVNFNKACTIFGSSMPMNIQVKRNASGKVMPEQAGAGRVI